MAVERRNPLPAGVYWIDVFGANREKFAAWTRANKVHVSKTESFDSTPPRDWLKFEVTTPVPWDAKTFGFPTIIEPGSTVNTSDDTVQKPPPETGPNLDDLLPKPGQLMLGIGLAIGIGLILTRRR